MSERHLVLPIALALVLSIQACGSQSSGTGGYAAISANLVFHGPGIDTTVDGEAQALAAPPGTLEDVRLLALDNDIVRASTTISFAIGSGSLTVPADDGGSIYTIKVEGLDAEGMNLYSGWATEVLVFPDDSKEIATIDMWPAEGDLIFKVDHGVDPFGDTLLRYNGVDDPASVASKYAWSDSLEISGDDMAVYHGNLYFMAHTPSTSGYVLWSYDGINQPAPVTGDEFSLDANARQTRFRMVHDRIYFNASQVGGVVEKLFNLDDTGIPSVTEVTIPGQNDPIPDDLTVFKDLLLFSAKDNGGVRRLWSYDGTDLTLLAPDAPAVMSDPAEMTMFLGRIYFSASDGVERALWSYDGATVSKVPLSASLTDPVGMMVYNGQLYFAATGSVDTLLWSFDGSSGLVSVSSLYPTGSAQAAIFNGKVNFVGSGGTEDELLEYDSASGLVTSVLPGDVNPYGMAVFQDSLYFGAYQPSPGTELWSYDGGSDPTPFYERSGSYSSSPGGMIVYSAVNKPLYELDGSRWLIFETFEAIASSLDPCYAYTPGETADPYYFNIGQRGNAVVIQGTLGTFDGSISHDGSFNGTIIGETIQYKSEFNDGTYDRTISFKMDLGGSQTGIISEVWKDQFGDTYCEYRSSFIPTKIP